MNKRAFEIQFNWVFVLIAGAVILIFFTALVVRQKSVSESSSNAAVLNSIDAIITGASVTTSVAKLENIPKSNIEISCNRISIGSASKQYQNLILFAPGMIEGDKLDWQTMPFSAPYRAANLLYITSPKARYIIITDTANKNIALEINKSMSAIITKEFYEISTVSTPLQIINKNNYKVRLIIFGFNPPDSYLSHLQDMQDSDVTAVRIDGNINVGFSRFFQKNGNTWANSGTSAYVGKPAIMGAVYSDTLENYKCNIRNAFSRLKLLSEIYIKRTQSLAKNYPNPDCENSYKIALPSLMSLNQTSYLIFRAASLDRGNADKIQSAAKTLSDDNKALQKFSCPLIY